MHEPAAHPRLGPDPRSVAIVFLAVSLLLCALFFRRHPHPEARAVQPDTTTVIGADLVASADSQIRLYRLGFITWNCERPEPEPMVSAWLYGTRDALLASVHEIDHYRTAKPLGCRGARAMWADPVRAARDEASAFCAQARVGVAIGAWPTLDAAVDKLGRDLANAEVYRRLELDTIQARGLIRSACATSTS